MSTVQALLDRVSRDYIDNPSDQQLQTRVTSLVNDSQETIVYSADLTTEEVAALGVGTVVEMDIEWMRVRSHAESTRTLTVTRGFDGTTPAEHVAGTMMRIAPDVSMRTLFDFLGDEIEALSPPLYAEATDWVDPVDAQLELPATPEPYDILSATQMLAGEPVDVGARLVRDATVFSTGVGVVVTPRSDADINVRYSVGLTRPTALADTLASLGVETRFERALIYGMLSAVLIQPDLDHSTQEFISEALQSQGFPPTTGTNLSVALSRMRDAEVRKGRDRQRARNGIRVEHHQVL